MIEHFILLARPRPPTEKLRPPPINALPRAMPRSLRLQSFAVLFLLMALFFIMTVAAEIWEDDFVKPHTLFMYLLISTLVTGLASLAVDIPLPS